MTFTQKLLKLDRRWIYLMVAICIIVPVIVTFRVPIQVTPETKGVYDKIESLPKDSTILLSLDYDPSSMPELYPMTLAILDHIFTLNRDKGRGLKVVAVTLWPTGPGLGVSAFAAMEDKFGTNLVKRGRDYAFLGYIPGGYAVVIGLGQDLKRISPTDYWGTPTSQEPIFEHLNSIRDVAYMVELAAGATVETWITYGSKPYGFPMGAGVTAVSAAGYYPYYNSKQITGLMGGLKGAAEYEKLANVQGNAVPGMRAQALLHFVLVIVVIVVNVLFIVERSKGGK